MATPADRVLVLFIDAAAQDSEPRVPALDAVASRGCSGFLVLSDEQTSERYSALHALLGMDADAPDSNGSFPFPKMPIAVFTDSQDASESVKALGVSDVELITSSAASRVESLLQPQDSKTKQLVVVHLSQYQADHWIFNLIEKLLGDEKKASPADCFVSIVRRANHRLTISREVAAHPLRPRQSYERHHGEYEEPTSQPPQRLLVSSVHGDRTRRDLATRFDEAEIDARGAYGAMDARIFMKEMAFRLGFAPKYGA